MHFSGHGGPGELVFEDAFGGPDVVPVQRMLGAMRRAAPARFPRFFYLACCHGGDPPQLGEGAEAGIASAAAQLHRDGVTQVVAYFGPVLDTQSTWAEAAFYRELARGRRTRDALRAARAAMARPAVPDPRPGLREAGAPPAAGLTPYAWAQLVLYQRGPDYPLGLPLSLRYAEAAEAPPARIEAPIPGSGRARVLRHGFVGRRRELHALRRDLRQGTHLHVVQGLGGLGKSSFCIEALKVYRRQGWEPLTLWCAEVEASRAPVEGLLQQLTDALAALAGAGWEALLAALDQAAAADPALQSPARRLVRLLDWRLGQADQPPLVLYLDNLESLLTRPDAEAGFGAWRDHECAALWRLLGERVQGAGGRLALLASCRYRHPDYADALFPLPRLPEETLWRLMGWFAGLRRLSRWSRERLVEHLGGHPRAVERLDALLRAALARQAEQHGELAPAGDAQAAEQEWAALIAPLLPPLGQRLSQDLLFQALWERVLDEPARGLLVRATVLRRPADWALLRALADPPAPDGAIRRLRDASLLTELAETDADGRHRRRFEVEASVAELARARCPDPERRLGEAHRRAGELLETRAATSDTWDDPSEAAYHLGAAGATDRAFDLLLPLTTWLYERGRYLAGLDTLASLAAPWGLGLRNEGVFAGLQGEAWAGLGALPAAMAWLEHAVACLQALADQDPSHAGWQHDLSVSYNKVGDSLRAQGDGAAALQAYRESLAIREALADQDPSHAGWQHDLSVSYDRVGDCLRAQGDGAAALKAYRESLAIREALADQDPSHAGWQRDLSVSYNKVGDCLAAQGDGAAALQAYRESLAIAERLADQDPSHAGWQADLALSCGKVSLALEAGSEEARALLERGLGILRGLQAESRLTATQLAWIAAFEQALRPEERPPWHRRLWAWLSRSR